MRGAARDRHERAVGCGGRAVAKTNAAVAYGEIVWVRRPDAGVKFEGSQRCPRAMVSQKAGSPGRSRISRKAIAQGRPDASAKPVCLRAPICCNYRTQDRGCGARPVFPAPSIFGGETIPIQLGRIAPRGGERVFVTPSFRGAATRRTRNLELPASMLRIAPE
jgi:hypothetical protein